MADVGSVIITQPNILSVGLEITGTAPLILNAFSQKTIEIMLKKHMGITTPRENKVPSQALEDATTRNREGRVSIPPTAFKKAMLTAASQIKTFKKTHLRTQLYVEGGSIPITYEGDMLPRMDVVITKGISRAPDLRFRPSYEKWKARLILQFSDLLAVQSVVDLLNRAGTVGVGEWRPEKDGAFGTFIVTRHISDQQEIEEVRRECASQLKAIIIPDWALDAEITPEVLKDIAGGRRTERKSA